MIFKLMAVWMVSEKSRKVAADIKSLRIQGASRIRAAFVRAIADDAKSSKSKNISSFRKEIKSAMLLLVSARCTEPEMRTAARIILHTLNSDFGNVGKLKNAVAKKCNDYEKNMQVKMKKMVRYGAKLVKKDSVIFTHCHSHTVVNAIIAAKPRVKEVIFTETRPLFQGHRTANDLSAAGIKGTMIVDSGAASMLPKAQIFFSGCAPC
jgi:translation initiation factor 2B subunit (eIF-2B alpha/beta/delta family)